MMRFFSILFLLLFVVPALPETSSARAANPDESQVQQTLYVNKASTAATQNGSSSAPYKTIMGAVNAWNKTTPTKILVYPGTYRETVKRAGQQQHPAGDRRHRQGERGRERLG
jgi:Tfp pilus assembly protein PilX